jgi:hypothetical protein
MLGTMAVEWFEAMKDWLETLGIDDDTPLFSGGVVTEFELPADTPFCILEIPQNRKTKTLAMNNKKTNAYRLGIQVAVENTSLYRGFLEVKYITDILSLKIMDSDTSITGIEDIEIGDVEYFYVSKKNKTAILYCSRLSLEVFTEETLEYDEIQYETLIIKLKDIQNTHVIETTEHDIAYDGDDDE